MAENKIKIKVDTTELDETIAKVNRLLELLQEASRIISLLAAGRT